MMADHQNLSTTGRVTAPEDCLASIERSRMILPNHIAGGRVPIGYTPLSNVHHDNSNVLSSLLFLSLKNERLRTKWSLEKAIVHHWVSTSQCRVASDELLKAKGDILPPLSEKVSSNMTCSPTTTTNLLNHKEKRRPTSSSSNPTATPASTNHSILGSSAAAKLSTKWLSSLQELKLYKQKYGDCIVPRGYSANPKLASWVAEQRKQYKLMTTGNQSSITPERIQMLNGLGFAWNAQEEAWNRQIRDLKSFFEENGHCHVSLNHKKYPRLGLWVKEQRRHYTLMKQGKQSHMTEERIKALADVGFCWDTHEAIWMERLRELSEFKERHGSCLVPTNYSENPKLGTWVHHQRRQYKKFMEGKSGCHITKERIQALDRLGFVWCLRESKQSTSGKSSSSSSSVTTNSSSSVCSVPSASESSTVELDFRERKRRRCS